MCLRRQFAFAMLVLLFSSSLIAATQWDKKPPAQWSDKDAEKLLNSSPWSQTQTFTEVVQPTTDVRRDAPIGQSRVPDDVRVNFRVRFLTAKPVRLAMGRSIELQQKGEMSEKQAADLKNFVEGEDRENVIVSVIIDTPRPSSKFSEARSVLATATTSALKQNTYLAVKGQKVFLKEYVPPRPDGLGARFIFPRMVDGAPYITPEAGEIRFTADLPKGFALSQRFKPKDMMYEGKLEY